MITRTEDILDELTRLSHEIHHEELDRMAEVLAEHYDRRVFVAGAGRSGAIASCFASRLTQLGFHVYLTGTVTAPPIQKDDVLWVLSGSGRTRIMRMYAETARECGACIMTMTLDGTAPIAASSHVKAVLPGTTRLQKEEKTFSIQPIGSSFEQLSFLCCEEVVSILMEKLHKSREDLIASHANLE
jgi:6-phospho-3-hexuloisomerase